MKVIKTYIFIILPIVLFTIISCNGFDQSAAISISHNIINGKIKLDDTLKVKVNFLKSKSFKNNDFNDLLFDIKSNNNNYELKPSFYNNETNEYCFLLNELTLGKKELKISLNNIYERLNFTVLNDVRPVIYNYEIINIFNRKRNNYTQGFEFYNDTLYESVGQYGKSKLIKVDFKNGKHLKELKLPAKYFAEGITILNNKIHLLTWKEKVGFVYNLDNFNQIKTFEYNESKEGWGFCNDGNSLYKSDGTEKIWMLDKETYEEQNFIEIYTNKNKVVGLNELEWIEGKIFANRYLFNGLAIINPKNGAVEGVINLSDLKNKVTQHENLDVINGVAYNPKRKTIFVTGKMWDKIFEIKILENE
tara:strand:- start:271 stop:1356 length:1086 start_codon:yes stop_codon:yes gene_type:complete